MTMNKFLERRDLFPTPVYMFQYEGFDQVKDQFIQYLTKPELYLEKYERNGLQITEGNLYEPQHAPIAPLRDFLHKCAEDTMEMMGYDRRCGITTMWATRQRKGAVHHDHIHKNAFLIAVFYLYDHDNNATGTMFKSPLLTKCQIQPPLKKGAKEFLTPMEILPFVPGTCAVFPAWALHGAIQSASRYRILAGVNVMPIGKANGDHYHQYEFPDTANMKYLTVDEHKKVGYEDA